MLIQSCIKDSDGRHAAHGFYRDALRLLNEAGVPYLIGGAYALCHYTGIVRETKDLDVFVRPRDCRRVLGLFSAAGYATEWTFPHWLGKIFHGELREFLVDIIFSSGNAVVRVDDDWFTHAVAGDVLGQRVRLIPAEEMIWSKGYIMERERFDGADIAHLILARGRELDWRRLLDRFGPHWRVLLSHLILFGFAYPGEREQVPGWVLGELLRRLGQEMDAAADPSHSCQGTLLSRQQYLVDIEQRGYEDPRQVPRGHMTAEEIQLWTDAIQREE